MDEFRWVCYMYVHARIVLTAETRGSPVRWVIYTLIMCTYIARKICINNFVTMQQIKMLLFVQVFSCVYVKFRIYSIPKLI
jgi:hypothetical protein